MIEAYLAVQQRILGCRVSNTCFYPSQPPLPPLPTDYDLDGARGVGSAGGLALARHLLLQGGEDADNDDDLLERLAERIKVRGPVRSAVLSRF